MNADELQERATDLKSSTPANRRKAYECAADLEAELRGDAPPFWLLTKRERRRAEVVRPQQDDEEGIEKPSAVAAGEWVAYRKHFKETHLSGLSDGYGQTIVPILRRFERSQSPFYVSDVKSPNVRRWFVELRNEGIKESTIRSYWNHLRAFLSFAVDDGLIESVPKVRLPKSKKKTKMKGRPFSGEELDRIIEAVKKKRTQPTQATWIWSLKALWYSGLRISEAYRITWEPSGFWVDMSSKYPEYVIEEQKSGNFERLPIVPDFCEMLEAVPKQERNGRIFSFPGATKSGELGFGQTKKVISNLGKEAKIRTGKDKTAGAHDFRRSFASRWATRVMPQILQALMRHSDITTTMKFYTHIRTADINDAIQIGEQIRDSEGEQTASEK